MASAGFSDGWSVFDQAPGALVLAAGDRTIVRANAAFAALVGGTPAELVGRDGSSLVRADDREESRDRARALLAGGPSYAIDQRFEHADGHDVWLRIHVGAVEHDGERLLMAQVEDTTEHRRTTARLQRLAERDHLTGLMNRRRIEEELEAVLAGVRRHGRPAALVLTDLDHFKAVNDNEGHEGGDRVLSFVAATLAARVREEDVVARLGGDEFAVLLRETTLAHAEGVAAELVALVSDADYTSERGVTLSAGVAALTAETRNAHHALHLADLAMYAAKAAGRDRVAVHGAVSITPRATDPVPRSDGRNRLEELNSVAENPTVDHALRAVRELLGMDVSYLTRHTETEQILLATSGDAASFGVGAGTRMALEETYCEQILRGDLPSAMSDVRAHPRAAALPVTAAARVGSYASVPVRLADGTLYGTLCVAGHSPVAELGERDKQFLAVIARMVAGELEREEAVEAQAELRVQAAGTAALLTAVEARDRYTGAHSREVVALATAVAAQLGLPDALRRQVAQVALLHDIGKLTLPDAVLGKRGPLTPDEVVLMRRHPEEGERIVARIPELAHLAPAIRAEHERWDGMGYPDGLTGEDIPIASRIVFVSDAWDAMTSDRPYRRGMPHAKAKTQLTAGAASQFCAVCVDALMAVLARGWPTRAGDREQATGTAPRSPG